MAFGETEGRFDKSTNAHSLKRGRSPWDTEKNGRDAMSGVTCMLFLANICMQNISAVEIHDSGLSASATVHGADYTAEIVFRSDWINTPDWKNMSEACWEGVCIAYNKWCAEKKATAYCEYQFSQPGDTQNTIIKVSAQNQLGLANAEKGLAVLTRNGWDAVQISLEHFTILSESQVPPSCGFRKSQTTCWPTNRK